MINKEKDIEVQTSNQFTKMLLRVTEALIKYTTLSNRTAVQEAGYIGFVELLKKSLPVLNRLNGFIDEALHLKLTTYYYLMKEMAEEGDQNALMIYQDLAPGLEKLLFVPMNEH